MPGARRAVPSAHRPVPPVPAFPAEERKWGSDDGGDNDGYRETFPQLRLQLGDDSVSSVDDYQDAHSQMGNDSFDLPLLQPEAR